MTPEPHDQARQGLLASVAGKAKEIVGAVTGSDSLAREGALQQAEAAKRKEALVDYAVAEHEAAEAVARLQAERRVAENQKQAAERGAEARAEQLLTAADEDLQQAELANDSKAVLEATTAEVLAARAEREEQAETAQELAAVRAREEMARLDAESKRRTAQQAEKAAARARNGLNEPRSTS